MKLKVLGPSTDQVDYNTVYYETRAALYFACYGAMYQALFNATYQMQSITIRIVEDVPLAKLMIASFLFTLHISFPYLLHFPNKDLPPIPTFICPFIPNFAINRG